MLNDKEKQAMSKLREIIDYDKKHRLETIYDKEQIEFRNNIELVLNLVEKLERENYFLEKEQAKRNWIRVKENGELVPLFYISKDKIREKIKELEQQKDLFFKKAVIQGRIDLLKELLEEE